jgi:hypothetical protein
MQSFIVKFLMMNLIKATVNWYQMDLKEIVFQQDNDPKPKHTAQLTKQWFAK